MKLLLLGAVVVLSGCGGSQQSMLNAAGTQSSHIAGLWWFFLWLLGAIFAIVIGVLLTTLLRRHRGLEQEPVDTRHGAHANTERELTRTVTIATVVSVIILLGLIVLSISTGKALAKFDHAKNGLVIEVTGNQWWWSVRYLNDRAHRIVITANEIHIPTGRPVMMRLTSNDVIHSFWVPALHGKRDLIPSRVNTEWLEADRPGRYRGQCAEFCGIQHAHMALWVVAEPPDQFEAWMRRQLQPGIAPTDAVRQHGQQVFLDNACVFCHAIAGTSAAGQVGPDLTHFGSRFTLAAGTLPNTKGNLGGWISDPQNIKPGNHMATVPLNPEDVEPLLDYLESLK